MPTLTSDMALTWSESRIAQMAESVRTLPPENFVHWTQQAELLAARGDNALARSCIEHAIETWGRHHANNHHFFTEIAVAALVVGHYDLVYDIVDQHLRPDWRFEIQIVEGISKVPYVIEWEIVSRTRSIFRFDAGIYRSDATHIIFLNWVWAFSLFDAYHGFGLAISGRTLLTLGDMAASPGLAFSAYRADAFLVPDALFLSKSGYRDAMLRVDQQQIPWAERRSVVFWRGSTTGIRQGDWRTLQRIKLCEAAQGHQDGDLFDVGITAVTQLGDPEWIAEVEASGLMRDFVPPDLFQTYKYQVDIDGNSNSWEGLFLKLYSGSPVLKVASPFGFRQWYYDDLKPWINYVPVAADLSDLAENATWLRTHDEHAELIGKRGRALARSLTYRSELTRAAHTVASSVRFFQDDRRIASEAAARTPE